jgi:hypothetical protein
MMMPQYGVSPGAQEATIMEKRWEGDALAWELVKILSGKIPVEKDGKVQLMPIMNVEPMINDQGINSIITVVRTYVSPQVVLSNFGENEAGTIIKQACQSLREHLALRQQDFKINKHDLDFIYSQVRTLIVAQVLRARNGHEARNSRTQTIEQQQHSFSETKQGGGFSLWPSRKKGNGGMYG